MDLTIREQGGDHRVWNLAADVSGDLLAGNPHADSLGHRDVWHFYHEAVSGESSAELVEHPHRIAPRSLARRAAGGGTDTAGDAAPGSADARTGAGHGQARRPPLRSAHLPGGPLLGRIDCRSACRAGGSRRPRTATGRADSRSFGLPPETFGKHPRGGEADRASLLVQAPSVVEFRLPAELVAGREFVATASLDRHDGAEGSVQVQVLVDQPAETRTAWRRLDPSWSASGSAARRSFEASFDDFRRLFPAALCYSQIVPVDEVVTLALYHREDENLSRLMLDEPERRALERLWEELWYVSQEAFKVEVGYVQFMEYTTQDSDPNLFKHLQEADRRARRGPAEAARSTRSRSTSTRCWSSRNGPTAAR